MTALVVVVRLVAVVGHLRLVVCCPVVPAPPLGAVVAPTGRVLVLGVLGVLVLHGATVW